MENSQGEPGEKSADKYLTFLLGDVGYGLPIQNVVEIIGMQPITPVPRVPEFVRGVINLRGQVIPVMDVRLRFAMHERAYDDRTCIIVSQVAGVRMGLVVDTVSEVLDILAQDIESTTNSDAVGSDNIYLEGIGKIDGDVKLLLNAERLILQDTANSAHAAMMRGVA
jgi:purine-binding chemotaxis protein CheW